MLPNAAKRCMPRCRAPSLAKAILVLDYLVDALRLDSSALEPLQLLRSRLVRSVNLDPQAIDDARTSAYTLWVLTREGTMTTAQLEALRASMTSRFEGWERDAAASFLAAAYSRLRLRDEARSLVKSTPSTARAAGAWTPETAAALAASALSEAGLGQEPAARFLVSMAGEDLARAFGALRSRRGTGTRCTVLGEHGR